jgi:hypothetical protein
VSGNRHVLATLVRYLREQGLTHGTTEADALFAPTTRNT